VNKPLLRLLLLPALLLLHVLLLWKLRDVELPGVAGVSWSILLPTATVAPGYFATTRFGSLANRQWLRWILTLAMTGVSLWLALLVLPLLGG
jgi:hypothetical protein